MNAISQLYEFLAGPCLYITLALCFTGLARKTMIILSGRKQGLRFLMPHARQYIPADFEYADSMVSSVGFSRRDAFLAVTSTVFHISIIAAPLSAAAHAILFSQAWNVMPLRINPDITGILTVTAIITGLLLLLRRISVRHVSAVSSWKDYTAMFCVLVPFVTGIFARMQTGPYEILMILHCTGAHVLLLAMGWTRLGHMIFFTAGYFASEVPGRDVTV